MKGAFITLEGVEGCGKTTQVRLLRERLESQGRRVVCTREPGGTPIAEAIRGVLLDPRNTAMSPTAELLLYEAARAQHVDEFIQPNLQSGAIVLCDRFADSTTAYQGAGRSIEQETVLLLHRVATRGTWPDLTLVIDLPAEQGLARCARSQAKDRMEQEPLVFHEAVRSAFLQLAEREPERVKVVDGRGTVEEVASKIGALVRDFLACWEQAR